MKALLGKFIFATFALTLTLLMFTPPVVATEYTLTGDRQSITGYAWMRWSHTFAAVDDTVYCNIEWSKDIPGHAIVGALAIGRRSLNGDSVDLSVRYQVSDDGTNWETFTLGTDSTTWVTSVTSGFEVKNVNIDHATHFGFHPYQRLMIWGNAGNLAGTVIRVDAKDQ
jgi:hypothetical protein